MKYYTINEEAAARAKEMYSWQRHLNSNGKYAVEKVLEILKDIAKEA